MKNITKKVAVILTLAMALTICFSLVGCGDKNAPTEENALTEKEQAICQLVLDASYKFKNPSSVRIVSGKVNYGTTDTDNPPYEFRDFELERGYYINANLRLSATNGFGATTTGYYRIIYDKQGNLSIEDINDNMKDTMDKIDQYPSMKLDLLLLLQTLVDWYDECELQNSFDIDKINNLLDNKWNK